MKTIDRLSMFHMAVNNMDKVKEFYLDKLGFEVKSDFTYDKDIAAKAGVPTGSRWISIALPGGTTINLTNVHENMKPGSMKLYLATSDIEKVFKELTAKGVKPANEITDAHWDQPVRWFDFNDPDGNHWFVVQSKS
jgi:uncharacterized glyoxalase superfamily protein PhnB